MGGLKSLLIRFPALYERVQALRDARYLKQARAAGTYAQHGEDRELLRLLQATGSRGPYLDVGCNHPFKLSNTYLLYESGWRGVCVDPLPRFQPLYRRWRPQDRFVLRGIGEQAGMLDFFEFESDVLSTLDPSLAQAYQRQGYRLLRQSHVQISRLDDVLQECGLQGPLSLLSIDIEGHELEALRSMDLARWRPALICIEVTTAAGHQQREPVDYLLARGYEVALDLGLNLVLKRRP